MTENERGADSAASRRTVLRAAAATVGIGGVANVGAAQPADIELDGEVAGWVGRAPAAIAGETNPTLALEPGRTYRVRWTNADGAPHNFVVEDADGNRLAETDVTSEAGATRTVAFEATAEMAAYYCEVHPESMRGRITVGGETTAGEAAAEDPTATETGPPPVIDAETVVLGARAAYWLGLAPSAIQGRRNPTLRLRAGREYELVWINLDGEPHDFHLTDAAGEELADTSDRDDVGDTHDTSFEAAPGMAEYYCDFHPQSMRGAVEVG